MKKHPLLGYFLLTFLITWGIGAIYLLFPAQLVALTSKDADRYHPLFVFAACAPTLSAFAVVLSLRGRQGLLLFWARYLDTGIRRPARIRDPGHSTVARPGHPRAALRVVVIR